MGGAEVADKVISISSTFCSLCLQSRSAGGEGGDCAVGSDVAVAQDYV